MYRMPTNWRLYVVTDAALSRGRSHEEVAQSAIAGGADAIQLRDKNAPGRLLFETALKLRELTRSAGIPFIVNDRVDIALAAEADGVHVGQEDLPATETRRLTGSGRILGVSAATLEQALQAERDGADYIGFGPVFEARATKSDAGEPTGLEVLAAVCAACRIPVVAIGGIQARNVAEVIRAGAVGAAVISAVVGASDIAGAARELKQRLLAERQRLGL